jgi:hypothetical protein
MLNPLIREIGADAIILALLVFLYGERSRSHAAAWAALAVGIGCIWLLLR